MTTLTTEARSKALAAGYYIRQGSYQGTPDDKLGRWYVGHEGYPFQPHGAGHATQRDAWLAAAEAAGLGVKESLTTGMTK